MHLGDLRELRTLVRAEGCQVGKGQGQRQAQGVQVGTAWGRIGGRTHGHRSRGQRGPQRGRAPGSDREGPWEG